MFEGLLPEPHNKVVLDLLFILATWHAYAKLRLHTTTSLKFLNETTILLGKALRGFANSTCEVFDTQELPQEEAARGRRRVAIVKNQGAGPTAMAQESRSSRMPAGRSMRKRFNLCTYKLHALGDYVNAIWMYGTTDNYTTQIVRFPKSSPALSQISW